MPAGIVLMWHCYYTGMSIAHLCDQDERHEEETRAVDLCRIVCCLLYSDGICMYVLRYDGRRSDRHYYGMVRTKQSGKINTQMKWWMKISAPQNTVGQR